MVDQAAYQRELKERDKRQKFLEAIVEPAMERVLNSISSKNPRVTKTFFYGAMGIDPKHLVTWYIFSKDKDLEEAKQNGLTKEISEKMRVELFQGGYPAEVLQKIFVDFTSEEDVQNKTGGNYYHYFK
jgi:hypothetical protein